MEDWTVKEIGRFDVENREYIVNRYDTERPWINYLSNGSFCTLMSQTGGGYSFWREPKYNRITKYRYDNHPQDRSGKYLYFRDSETGDYWSNGWQPVMKTPEAWECRHGMGYTQINSTYSKISCSATYFVPTDDDVEVCLVKMKNNDSKTRKIKVTPFVEFSLFNAQDEMMSYANLRYFCDAKLDTTLNAISYFMHHHCWMGLGKVFMAVTEKITGYTVERRHFFGNYRSEANPIVIETGIDHNKPVFGSDCVGAPSFEITLKPGEEKIFSTMLGVDNNSDEKAATIVKKYSQFDICEKELKIVKQKWINLLGNFNINCPDNDVNLMVNTWNQYQCKVAFDWSRWASYYHMGTYRGIGFRDTNQDSLGMMHIIPDQVKEKIKLLAQNMFEDGHCMHSFFPGGGSAEGKKYGDDHIWILLSTYYYICETGDLAFLDEEIAYLETERKGTLFEHLNRAIEYALRETGHYGLPKMFFADWNDCLNNICLKEKGEKGVSVMVGMQAYQFGKYLVEMAKWAGKEKDLGDLDSRLESLKKIINDIAWDGDWYIRAFTDENKAVGSKKSDEGNLFLNPQSWSVLSGVADDTRGKKAMDMVSSRLDTDFGIKLLDPPYTKFPLDIGSVIHYPGGIKENGGIFNHANTWAIIAETKLKRADRAFKYYKQILPPILAKKIGYDKYRLEPYVYCQFVTGPDHPDHGSASHSWLTGTCVWNFVAISQHILGVRPTFNGLLMDPCIPAEWPEYTVDRKYRGATYHITVKNPNKVSSGVQELIVNGKKIDGTLIPIQKSGTENTVVVTLG